MQPETLRLACTSTLPSIKKTCVHIAHPDGKRLIPFDTYNMFYRDHLERDRLEPLPAKSHDGLLRRILSFYSSGTLKAYWIICVAGAGSGKGRKRLNTVPRCAAAWLLRISRRP